MARAVLIRRAVWGLACVSLEFGVWRSVQPDALVDFDRVVEWTRILADGASPYTLAQETDYPPWALLTLAPLLLVPASLQSSIWIGLNLLLAVVVARTLVRTLDAPRDTQRLLLGVLLAASCFRVLGQFSLLSFACAIVGARHPSVLTGGVLLGLGLMKPQVGGAIWLAHLLMGDWRRVAIAAAVPAALTLGAAAAGGIGPVQLLIDFARVLEAVHGGAERFTGHTELEGWLAPWFPAVTTVAGAAVIGLVLITPAVVAGWRRWAHWAPPRQLELYALCGVVSLLATRHLSYDFLLLLPLLVAWGATPRRPAWGVTAVLLIGQFPGWWRRVFEPMGWPESLGLVVELDRLLCAWVFGLLTWSLMRLDMTK